MRWTIFICFYLLINFYAFQAIRTISKSNWVMFFYFLVSLIILGNFIFQWMQDNPGGGLTGARAYSLGFVLAFMAGNIVVTLFMFGEDIVRLFTAIYYKIAPSATSDFGLPSRRKFLSQIALGIAAIPFSSLLYGMYQGRYNFKVLNYTLYFDDLPAEFDGYRLAQISDIHSGSFDNKKKIKYGIDLINEQHCDTVMFTGDLVNNSAEEMEPWKEVFSSITAKDGVFSVLGNHDYGDYIHWNTREEKKANLEQLKSVHKEMGWNLLLNEHRFIEKNGQRIAIVGVENWGAGGFKKNGDLDLAGEGLSVEEFKILLSHDPSYWKEKVKIEEKKYHLTLSGHTHGMQFGIEIPGWFKWSPVQYRYENWAGIYEEYGRYINVNRGFGFLAYPGRVGIWPEISVIEFRKGSRST